jgi:hypothetical protein
MASTVFFTIELGLEGSLDELARRFAAEAPDDWYDFCMSTYDETRSPGDVDLQDMVRWLVWEEELLSDLGVDWVGDELEEG